MKKAKLLAVMATVAMAMMIFATPAGARGRTSTSNTSLRSGIPVEVILDDSVGSNAITIPEGLSIGGTTLLAGPVNVHLSGRAKGNATVDLLRGTLSINFTSIDIKTSSIAILTGCPTVTASPIAIRQNPAKSSTGVSSLRTGQVTTNLNVIARSFTTIDGSACGNGGGVSNYVDTPIAVAGSGSMKIALGSGPKGTIVIGSMKTSATATGVTLAICGSLGSSSDPCPPEMTARLDPATVKTDMAGKVAIVF